MRPAAADCENVDGGTRLVFGHTLLDGQVQNVSAMLCVFPDSIFTASIEQFRFGYITNTKVKIILVVDSGNTALRENEVRAVSS